MTEVFVPISTHRTSKLYHRTNNPLRCHFLLRVTQLKTVTETNALLRGCRPCRICASEAS